MCIFVRQKRKMTMKLRAFLLGFFAVAGVLPGLSGKTGDGTLTLLYWNIQNGMWDGQTDDYQRFRIDFIYVTPALRKKIRHAAILRDDYTSPVRNPQKISNFWHPSDHLPIVMKISSEPEW